MKGSCTLIASALAASTVALRPSSASSERGSTSSGSRETASSSSSGKEDKFEPRFDGLRFIETLVTAHR